MLNFYRIIKTMNNNDTLTLFLEKDNDSVLGIKIENSDKNTTSTFNLNLFPSEFYYLDKMPTSIDITQVMLIIFFSLVISILATVYPAYKASKTEIRGILNNV